MTISSRRYVDIVSAVSGGQSVPSPSLVARIFTTNQLIGDEEILAFPDAESVLEFFGKSLESDFAAKYFSFVLPSPAMRPKSLQFAAITPEQQSTTLVGRGDVKSISEIKSGSNVFSIYVGGELITKEIDFEEISTYADLAASISESGKYSATFNPLPKPSFLIVSQGDDPVSSGDGSGLNESIGMGAGFTAERVGQAQTPESAFSESNSLNNNFGAFAFAYDITSGDSGLDDLMGVANANAALNGRHILVVGVTPENAETVIATVGKTGWLNVTLKSDEMLTQEHLPLAIVAATDYDRENSVSNAMYKQAGVTIPATVKSNQQADRYDAMRVNYYGVTREFGANLTFYQRGTVCGTNTMPSDLMIAANEIWLKGTAIKAYLDELMARKIWPASSDGIALSNKILQSIVDKALRNGVIMAGKAFNQTQINAIEEMTGRETLYLTVEKDGYTFWSDIIQRTDDSGATVQVVQYTLIYATAEGVRKVEGSHNMIGG